MINEILLGIGWVGFCLTAFWATRVAQRNLQLEMDKVRLQSRMIEIQLAGDMATQQLLKALEQKKSSPTQLDQQTISLIRLAVGNFQ